MQESGRTYWDSVAKSIGGHHLEPNVAEYKRLEHVRLLSRWLGGANRQALALKTDAYEEFHGTDSFLGWLTGACGRVWVVDVSKEVLNGATRRGYGAFFLNASVTSLPTRGSSLDLIVSNSTLDHLSAQDMRLALGEFSRSLRRGGILVLTLDNAHNPLYRLGYIAGKFMGLQKYHQERCYRKDEVIPWLEGLGFAVEETASIVHLPTPFNLMARMFSPLNRLLFGLPVRSGIALFSSLGLGGRNIYTGWFLAFKCVKR